MLDSELDKVCSFYRLKELEIYGEMTSLLKDVETYEAETDGIDMEDVIETENRKRAHRSSSIFNVFSGRNRRTSTVSVSIEEEDEIDDSDSDADEAQPLKRKPPTKQRSKSLGQSITADSGEDLRSPSLQETRSVLKRRPSIAMELEHEHPEQLSALYDSGISLKKTAINIYVSLCGLRSFIQLNSTGFKKALKKYDKVCNRDIRREYMEKAVAPAYPFRDTTMTHLDANIAKIEKIYADVVTKGDVSAARRELRLHLREHVVWERNTVWREMIGIERKSQAANFGIRQTLLGASEDPSKTRLQGDANGSDMKELRTPIGKYHLPKWLFSSNVFALVTIVAIFAVLLSVDIMKKPEQQNCLAMLVFVSLLWATEVIPLFVSSLLVPFLVVVLRIMRSEDKPYHRLDSKDATKVVFAAMWTPVIMLLLGGFTIAAALSKYHIAKMMATFVLSKAGTRPRTVLITNMFVGMFLSMWISNVAAIFLIWVLLLITFRPGRGTTIVPIRQMKDKLNGIQYFIIVTTVITIVLWCASHQLEGVFGDMGVIAIIPLVLFFGTGILTKEDFNNFLWTIIILAAGGLSLGKAVASSGLLQTIATAITERVSHFSVYGVLVVFAGLILVVATFISHTVAALIILPLVQQVGAGMKQPHPNLLVMGSALMCSAAMGLPTSGFPNMSKQAPFLLALTTLRFSELQWLTLD
jgi:di/tricarboxylate transporter